MLCKESTREAKGPGSESHTPHTHKNAVEIKLRDSNKNRATVV